MSSPWPYQPPPARRRRVWPWIVAAVVLVLVVIGSAGRGSPATGPSTAVAGPTTTSATPGTPPSPAAPPASAVPSFGDGTYEVGPDIPAGRYKTTGPPPGSLIGSCYWARLRDTSGGFAAIIANGNTAGPATVTVTASDGAVQSSGGCVWTKQ